MVHTKYGTEAVHQSLRNCFKMSGLKILPLGICPSENEKSDEIVFKYTSKISNFFPYCVEVLFFQSLFTMNLPLFIFTFFFLK